MSSLVPPVKFANLEKSLPARVPSLAAVIAQDVSALGPCNVSLLKVLPLYVDDEAVGETPTINVTVPSLSASTLITRSPDPMSVELFKLNPPSVFIVKFPQLEPSLKES